MIKNSRMPFRQGHNFSSSADKASAQQVDINSHLWDWNSIDGISAILYYLVFQVGVVGKSFDEWTNTEKYQLSFQEWW